MVKLPVRLKTLTFIVAVVVCFAILTWEGKLLFADQKELMDEWSKHKRQITERIVTKLRQEGKLPQYGTVEFTARVKPLPSGDLDIVIDHLKVYPKSSDTGASSAKETINNPKVRTTENEKVAREFQEIFRPRNPSPYWTTGTIDIAGGAVSSEKFRVRAEKDEIQVGGKTEGEKQQVGSSSEKTPDSGEKVIASPEGEAPKEEPMGWWSKFWQWLSGKSDGGKQ